MGLLAVGTPLTWEEASKYADHVRYHGITQLLNIWNRYKTRSGDKLYWGDEVSLWTCIMIYPLYLLDSDVLQIEYMVVAFDDEEKDARLSLRQTEILHKLGNVCSDLTSGPRNRFVLHVRPRARQGLLIFRPLHWYLAYESYDGL
jgi:glutamate--cysteine ligase catalytic subunit